MSDDTSGTANNAVGRGGLMPVRVPMSVPVGCPRKRAVGEADLLFCPRDRTTVANGYPRLSYRVVTGSYAPLPPHLTLPAVPSPGAPAPLPSASPTLGVPLAEPDELLPVGFLAPLPLTCPLGTLRHRKSTLVALRVSKRVFLTPSSSSWRSSWPCPART